MASQYDPAMLAEVSNVTLANGLTLSYAEQGGRAQPAVVLLPGATDSLWSYQPVLDRIPRSIRAVAVSPRGHGDSDKPATGYRVEDFASDVVPLLDALDIERAVLAGHSSSCLAIRRVAIDAPDRVAGLESFVQSVVSGLAEPIDPAFARAFVVDTSSDQLGAELIDTLVHEVMKVPARVWREMFGALLQYDDTAELRGISAPSLLIWGSADRLACREMQKELVRLLPRGRLLEYARVGHTPRWENTARFASDLTAFAVLSGAGGDSG
jgi:pimeloyl-ACP methyl ester carboxylesterase